jgi:hypothetical protein
MRETSLEPAVPAGIDPIQHAREIYFAREAAQSGAWAAVSSGTRGPRTVVRKMIRQDWDTMLRQAVDPRGVTPQFLDSRELKSLQDDPNLALAWQMLVHHLGVVRSSEFMATISDARGCVVRTGGNTKIRNEAERYGFTCGAKWAEVGTNGTRLVTQSLARGAQIYGPEHWMDSQVRWTCTNVGVFDPHIHRLRAVINVTGPWTKVHSDTLGRLYEIAQRIEDALRIAQNRTRWRQLGEAAGPLVRIGGPALVIDRDGVVVAAHEWIFQTGDHLVSRVEVAKITPGQTFLPALGWCMLEPLPMLGWLVRSLRHDENKPDIRVTLDLTEPNQPKVRVGGPNVFWHCRVRPLHATILQRLASRPDGLTPAELSEDLYGPGAKTSVFPEMSKLRNELGVLLQRTSRKPGDNRYRFSQNVTVDIQSPINRQEVCSILE